MKHKIWNSNETFTLILPAARKLRISESHSKYNGENVAASAMQPHKSNKLTNQKYIKRQTKNNIKTSTYVRRGTQAFVFQD